MLPILFVIAAASPNVVVVSVDTLRADRLGCYGYEHPTSPVIDEFASQGLLFEDCVTEVPLTAPSFGAMMSSRYPRMNGSTRNGLRMPSNVPLVAEQFQKAGYETVCVTSNWTLKAGLSGLDRGFDVYDDGFRKKRWGFLKSERDGDEVTKRSLDLLKKRDTSKPLFAWFHYSDPHAPYLFHKRFNPRNVPVRKLDKEESVQARYDSEVAFTDHEISKLLRALPSENTFVVFVADHGESLYEHDYLGHGRRIHQTGLHIPLILKGPGIEPGRSAFPARGIDIGPTLLAMAGLSAPETMLGLNLLAPPTEAARARVIETYGGAVPGLPGAEAMMADAPPMWQGVIRSPWKLIRNEDEDDTELYNLVDDPRELINIAEDHPEVVGELSELIAAWSEQTDRSSEESADLTKEDVQALKSLGYVD
ncbi:MAG: hypothetical protein AMXMBFR84_14800 [Candidatus Hydrogenedentota bacterium]